MLFHHTEFRARKASGFLNDASQVTVTGIEKCQAQATGTSRQRQAEVTVDHRSPTTRGPRRSAGDQAADRRAQAAGSSWTSTAPWPPSPPIPNSSGCHLRPERLLDHLARRYLVCVVSGRGLEDLRRKVGLGSVYYAADSRSPHRRAGGVGDRPRGGTRVPGGAARPPPRSCEQRCVRSTESWSEAKGLSVSVHYRLVAEAERPLTWTGQWQRWRPGILASV